MGHGAPRRCKKHLRSFAEILAETAPSAGLRAPPPTLAGRPVPCLRMQRHPASRRRYGQNDPVIAMGRKAWLFAGSELAGQRAAIVMSLVQSARMHGHDPWAYLKDVLTRLPGYLNSRIDELLPHRWQPAG